ncbi:membrane protein implicated in regulation of membrane protease activity [Kibdelosporangium banguiense]|uniref:Membrane protein implicated in regulation of membrane protease activity n=1 Tax=Kibdelosporangium banguiense TaxID=1365924 RepID=A0ABS4TBM0_9PSEU|nr:hypothetical protein [Kibdelosporangium banguiense]MBP2321485.1 membrane protein implicated in regulation of membrane protease activity [Kibdelosporangium banguiense]
MNTPLLMLVILLAAVALIVLWRLVLTAAAIAVVQWMVVAHADSVTVQLLTFAVPAFLAAFVLVRLIPHRTPTGSAHAGQAVADLQGVAR